MVDSKPKLADFLDELTVKELDEQLLKLGRAWTRVYVNRQLLAKEEGITTPPPLPPTVEMEALTDASVSSQASKLQNIDQALDGTIGGLIHSYLNHPRSPFHPLRHSTRQNYAGHLKRIKETCGSARVVDLNEIEIQRIHDEWSKGGQKISVAHALITMVRTLAVFGATVLNDKRCERFSFVLHRMKFKVPESRNEPLSEEQAIAVIKMANDVGLASLGLAQALQFWSPLRQKDVIGEWVPLSEPDQSKTFHKDMKWVRGVLWDQIDENFDLQHVTSKEGKAVNVSLTKFPQIMNQIVVVGRKATGPVIVSELTDMPWTASEFRRQWRRVARLCGISDQVKNRDSGPSVSSEAIETTEKSTVSEINRATEDLTSVARH